MLFSGLAAGARLQGGDTGFLYLFDKTPRRTVIMAAGDQGPAVVQRGGGASV
jgi:hypothetical protein